MSDEPGKCVFCAIISGETKADVIDEGEHYIAFLDHRPLFYGHTLLVPKVHIRLLSRPARRPGRRVPHQAQRLERAVEDGLGRRWLHDPG